MKNVISVLLTGFVFCIAGRSQDADWDNVKWNLTQLCQESYHAAPFSGVKLTTYEGVDYLLSAGVSSSAKGKAWSTLSRMAEMKARRAVVEFVHGSVVTSETVLSTVELSEVGKAESIERFQDNLREQSHGVVNGLEVLTSFDDQKNDAFVVVLYVAIKD